MNMKIKIGELRRLVRSVLTEVNFPGRPTGYGVEPFDDEDQERLANAGFPTMFEVDDLEEEVLTDETNEDSGG
jgi:hypothetical protein